jgi:hypothetical protein
VGILVVDGGEVTKLLEFPDNIGGVLRERGLF